MLFLLSGICFLCSEEFPLSVMPEIFYQASTSRRHSQNLLLGIHVFAFFFFSHLSREGVFSSSFSLPLREGQREGEVTEEKYFLRKNHPHPHPHPHRQG